MYRIRIQCLEVDTRNEIMAPSFHTVFVDPFFGLFARPKTMIPTLQCPQSRVRASLSPQHRLPLYLLLFIGADAKFNAHEEDTIILAVIITPILVPWGLEDDMRDPSLASVHILEGSGSKE